MCMLFLPWYPLSLILSISNIQVNEQKTYKLLCCKVGKDKNETEDRFKKTEQQNRCMRSHEYLGGYYRKHINNSNTWHV